MALRGVKPAAVQKRLKAFIFGQAGVGKTTAAIQFPSPYLIDTERGAENDQYVRALEAAGGAYFHTTDLDEIIEETRSLLTEKHNYRTLIIDPITVPYNSAVDRSALNLARLSKDANSDGTEFGRHKNVPDRAMKRLMALATQLDMNVIMTSHSKGKWEKVGDKIEQVGNTFDAYSKVDYLFDLVIEVQLRGKERVGMVRKSRVEAFGESLVFPFNYQTIADLYGHDILERRAGVVTLATPDQVAKIHHLVEVLKIEPEIIDKWFSKASTDRFEEFSEDAASKVLAWLESRLTVTPIPTTTTINANAA